MKTERSPSFLQQMHDHPSFNDSDVGAAHIDFESGSAPAPKPVTNLDIHRVLYHYSKQCDVRFHLAGNPVEPSQVFGKNQFLPIIGIDAMRVWHSLQQNAKGKKAIGDQPFNAYVRPDPKGLFGMQCQPSAITNDLTSTLRLLVWTLSARRVMGLRLNADIDLEQRILAWNEQRLVIDWNEPLLPQIPLPKDMDADFFMREFIPVQKDEAAHSNLMKTTGQSPR